jgi:hypothetical protein
MIRQMTLFIMITLVACTDRKLYENKTENYKLILKKDSVYILKYPTYSLLRIFPRKYYEKGTYNIVNDSILLEHRNQFIGEKTMVCYSKYAYSKDSIIFMGETWKGTPKKVLLKKR